MEDTANQVKRFACDRCHGQKLRCPRPANGGEPNVPCLRCQKAGKACNISSPLKTGRPSKALKNQIGTEQQPSIDSRPLSRTSSNNTISAQAATISCSIAQEPFSDGSMCHSLGSERISSPPENGGFRGSSNISPPLVTDNRSEFVNFNLDNFRAADISCFGSAGAQDLGKLENHCPKDIRSQI